MKPPTSPEIIEAIKGAPVSESHDAVAARLGVARNTVRRYRKEARCDRQEAARGIIAEQVEAHLPDALSDLIELRRLAKQSYQASKDYRDGGLWLSAIKATLEHVAPDDAELDRMLDEEVQRLAGAAGQAEEARDRAGSAA